MTASDAFRRCSTTKGAPAKLADALLAHEGSAPRKRTAPRFCSTARQKTSFASSTTRAKEIFFAFRLVKIPALERGCPRPSVVSIIVYRIVLPYGTSTGEMITRGGCYVRVCSSVRCAGAASRTYRPFRRSLLMTLWRTNQEECVSTDGRPAARRLFPDGFIR